MKKLSFFRETTLSLFILLLGVSLLQAQPCANRALDFDGATMDYVSFLQSPVDASTDFTVEAWITSTDTDPTVGCSGNLNRLFYFGGPPGQRFEIGECGGLLNIVWSTGAGVNVVPVASVPNIRDGNWHHLAIVVQGNAILIYWDCVQVDNIPYTGSFNFTTFRMGQWGGGFTNENWVGAVDEVRMWSDVRTQTEIDAYKTCLLEGTETDLQAYWPMDQGIDDPTGLPGGGGTNTGITTVVDASGNGNDGTLFNFALTGSIGNFVCSGSDLIYPDLHVRNLPRTIDLIEICEGDPGHFCLSINGMPASLPGGFTTTWQVDDGSGWTDITNPVFDGLCFPVGPGNLLADCASNADGFTDLQYRAIVQIPDPQTGELCTHISETYPLRICCPITNASVSVTPDDPLCEGDTETFTVTINSTDPFVIPPGPLVNISLEVNGNPVFSAPNQTTFTYTATTADIVAPNICFKAIITNNCANKQFIAEKCITVDPEPVCGTITGDHPNLIPDNTDPDLFFICPGNDAKVSMVNPSDFMDCIPNWEYSFDQTIWSPLGISNTGQNTNILPSNLWPAGATCIYYRIQCKPLSDPSGCDPCFSNTVKIQLLEAPLAASITGISPVCESDGGSLLTVSGAPMAGLTYTWLCNGLVVGTGPSYFADQSACYWVEISNGCQVTETAWFCLEICEIIPVISCPLPPNECADPNEDISITACDSEISCNNNDTSGFVYSWTWEDVLGNTQTASGCNLTVSPPFDLAGTTYKLNITDTNTGCSTFTETFIKPCKKFN
jgi:hypothetical protein